MLSSAIREAIKKAGEKELFTVWLDDPPTIEYEKLQNVFFAVPQKRIDEANSVPYEQLRIEPPPWYIARI